MIEKYYIAVRKTQDSGKEWFDSKTLSGDRNVTIMSAGEENIRAGLSWVIMNPVVRIATIRIEEIDV